MAGKVTGRKRDSLEKPLCKYGTSCYRKNPEHHKQFRHPSKKEAATSSDADSPTDNVKLQSPSKVIPADDPNVKLQSPSKVIPADDSAELSLSADLTDTDMDESASDVAEAESMPRPLSPKNVKDNIKEKFLVEMPPDFYDFWEFVQTVHKKDPSEALAEAGLHLVGPYDVLSKKIANKDIISDNILCHWRYYFDPPEFQTVIKKDGDDCYHIGYFRDDPSEMPYGLASNSATVEPKFKLVGGNIFGAIFLELSACIKKIRNTGIKEKLKKIQEDLGKFAKKQKYPLTVQTTQTKARTKKVVAKTFHGLGIVVPIRGEVGYRPLPDSDATIKAILQSIADCKTDKEKLVARAPLDEILTNIGFATDECDFGMGLEFGIDLFCFGDPYLHGDVRSVLSLAYDLLDRPEYSRIIRAHLKNRKKGDLLSIKEE